MWRWAGLMAGAIVAAGSGAVAADAPHLALVIGNSAYAALPPLGACRASASAVSAALKRAGFDVTERRDLSNGAMGAAITEFGDALARQPGSVAVVYACGYAVAFDGRVFLLPVSANLERATDTLTQGVVSRILSSSVLAAGASAGLVLLDSAAPPGRTAALPLDTMINPAGLGTTGFVAADSTAPLPDGATPLAAALVAGLATPEVEARAMLKDLQEALRGIPGLAVSVFPPASPAWLRGGPAAQPAPVAVPAPPPAAPPGAAAPAPTGPPPEPAMFNEADRRRVQLALQRLGYYDSTVDGIYGPETIAAIRRFQHELGTEMTGQLTAEQAARLLLDAR